MDKKILVIAGDGIGKEITDSARQVLEKVSNKLDLHLTFDTSLMGGVAYDATGTPLPAETLVKAKAADAILFGAVGGEKWDKVDPKLRPEQALLGIRKELGLYANLRPVKVLPELVEYSPLKENLVQGTDILIVRELVGGIYFGKRQEAVVEDGKEWAWDMENYSVPEVERIAKIAFDAARLRKGAVCSVGKADLNKVIFC